MLAETTASIGRGVHHGHEGCVDQKLHDDKQSGFRHVALSPQREAWKRGLAAFEAEARTAHGESFFRPPDRLQDTLLRAANDAAQPELIGARDVWRQENDTNHLACTARMGFDRDSSVVKADCRSWNIPNLWICDGSVFPPAGGINPSLTITAIALRTADRIRALHRSGDISF